MKLSPVIKRLICSGNLERRDLMKQPQFKKWGKLGTLTMVPVLSLSLISSTVLASDTSKTETSQVSSDVKASQDQTKKADLENVVFSKEEAIEKLKTLFPVLKKAEVSGVELGNTNQYPLPENQMVWNIHWNYSEGNGSYGFSSKVDALTGDIIETSIHGPLYEEKHSYYPPNYSREEALEKANAFIKEAAPSFAKNKLVLNDTPYYSNQPLFGPVNYNFSFQIEVNDIPVPSQSISISLDGNGNVTRFYRSSKNLNLPSAEPQLTLKEATEQFNSNLKLQLAYITERNGHDSNVFLGWQLANDAETGLIDAQTGEFLTHAGDVFRAEDMQLKEVTGENHYESITLNEGETISAEQAEEVVLKYLNIPENKQLSSKRLRENSWHNDSKVWHLVWRDPQTFRPEGESEARVDASTGKLISFREFRYGPNQKNENNDPNITLTEKELTSLAMEYINQLYPNATDNLKWRLNENPYAKEESNNQYRYYFKRFFNGLPVNNDSVTLTLNDDGKIVYYYLSETPDLESKVTGLKQEISKEQARKDYLANLDVKIQFNNFGGFMSSDGPVESFTKLVYSRELNNQLRYGYVLDAETGEWRSTYGNAPSKDQTEVKPIDLAGHWAEEQLETLTKHKVMVLDDSSKLNPNATISYGNWIQMMAKASNPNYDRYHNNEDAYKNITKDNEYYQAIMFSAQRGWLDEDLETITTEGPFTRESLADSIVRILGYDQIATFMGTNLDYDDKEAIQYKGAVELVKTLGIMNGNNNLFHPNREVTKAEAAVVMMRMVYLQGNTDQKIGSYRN